MTELLSLPSCAAELNLSPQRKREKLFEALLNQLDAEARRRPVLIVFEDAHWIDPTSRELLDLMVDRARRLPVLLAITFRPEFQPPWVGRSHVTSLALNQLGERDGAALAQRLAGNATLNADIIAKIVERTDGVPLFVEELTKAVLENAGQVDRVAAVLETTSLAALSVPATLHASLMARLDRLGPTPKEVAQIGAVLGREFAYEQIKPVAQRDERELQAALGQLADAGLLFCRGTAPHSSYLFKHALVQDTAYGTLLRGKRQELHARVAAVLELDFAILSSASPNFWRITWLAPAISSVRSMNGRRPANMPRRARPILKRSVISSAVLQHWRDWPKVRLGTVGRSSCNCPEAYRCSRPRGSGGRGARAYTRARDLAEQRGDPHQCSWQPMDFGNRPMVRAESRLPQLVEPVAATYCGRRR